MSVRLNKVKDEAKKFFTKAYPNIEFEYSLTEGEVDLLKITCSLATEEIEDILVTIYANTFGVVSLEATFGEIDKEDANVLAVVNEFNANEPVGKAYCDDYLNFALGTAGIEEGNMVKTMNTMLDYFAASLEDENLQELLSLTY